MDVLDTIIKLLEEKEINIPLEDKIQKINKIKELLHNISPFKHEPVDCVLWVKSDSIQANSYNPNKVSPPEMKLLYRSILEDGYTQPIVAWNNDNKYTVVDGFHRNRIGKEYKDIRQRIWSYLPITIINHERSGIKERMAATIRHNRARGKHAIDEMTNLIFELIKNGWKDVEIGLELGMSADEVLRFKQNVGLPELFSERTYNKGWE